MTDTNPLMRIIRLRLITSLGMMGIRSNNFDTFNRSRFAMLKVGFD